MNTIAPKNSLLWGLGCELALSTCSALLPKTGSHFFFSTHFFGTQHKTQI